MMGADIQNLKLWSSCSEIIYCIPIPVQVFEKNVAMPNYVHFMRKSREHGKDPSTFSVNSFSGSSAGWNTVTLGPIRHKTSKGTCIHYI